MREDQKLKLEAFSRRSSVGFIVCIWILAPYLLLQQFSLYQVHWLQESALDRQVPIYLPAIYIYFSYCFLLIWAGYATPDKVFVRFLKAVCTVTLVSHLCFFFFPTGISRDLIPSQDAPAAYQWLAKWDKPRNCLPSLHASLATLSTLTLWLRGRWSGAVSTGWSIAILWSAIALRQHITVDLAAGVILALIIWWLPNRWRQWRSK